MAFEKAAGNISPSRNRRGSPAKLSDEDAASQLSVIRAIASCDVHNWVYRADYRIVPAVRESAAIR
jgi:hypothetical protein